VVISSRTPEGVPNRCPVCGSKVRIEPSSPARDAPCPVCGSLMWFNGPMRRRQTQPVRRPLGKVAVLVGLFVASVLLVLAAERFGKEVYVLAMLAFLLFGRKFVLATRAATVRGRN
jgi:hypothetical protein